MRMRPWLVCLLVSLAPSLAHAQSYSADRVRFNSGPCVLSSADGTPDRFVFECPYLSTPAATSLTLNPTGDLITDPAGNDILPAVNYDINIGSPTLKYLSLSIGELLAETLVAQDVLATIGGRVIVAPTTSLTADLASGATSIQVKHNNLASGDRVYLQAAPGGVPQVEFMAITSGAGGSAGAYTYSVTRNLDGSGANTWTAGDAVLNTGQTGSGHIDLYSTAGILSGSGPTIAGNVRTGSTFNAIAPRWAIGNMNGLFGYATTVFGAAFGDPGGPNVTIDDTNGIRIRQGTTNKLVADTSGNLNLTGDLILGASSVFRSSSATSLTTGDGFYLTGGSSPTFRIGNPAGNRLVYETSSGVLSLYGPGGGGRNVIRNSDCWVGTTGWSTFTNSGQTLQQGTSASGFSLNDGPGTCWFGYTATPANGTVSQQYLSTVIPVEPGNWYEASAYLGVLVSGNTAVQIQWLEDDGATQVSVSTGNICTSSTPGGTELDDFCRSGVIEEAPITAYNARLVVTTTHDGSANPVIFHVHNYFGEANSEQTALTPWGPGGFTSIGPGLIETGAIVADNIAAGAITATKISVATLSGISANLGTITAGSISGTTITAGTSSSVTISSAGINFTGGNNTWNGIIWDGGTSYVRESSSNELVLSGSSAVFMNAGSNTISVSSAGTIQLLGSSYQTGFTGGGNRYICVDNSGVLFASGSACP